ncbi:hypothetical protein IG631_22302 [Alternaria alternata]|nr:hypothetical protein IG631_22302 [Alternaria alternata]
MPSASTKLGALCIQSRRCAGRTTTSLHIANVPDACYHRKLCFSSSLPGSATIIVKGTLGYGDEKSTDLSACRLLSIDINCASTVCHDLAAVEQTARPDALWNM